MSQPKILLRVRAAAASSISLRDLSILALRSLCSTSSWPLSDSMRALADSDCSLEFSSCR